MTERLLRPEELVDEARSAIRPTSRFRWRGVTDRQLRRAAEQVSETYRQAEGDESRSVLTGREAHAQADATPEAQSRAHRDEAELQETESPAVTQAVGARRSRSLETLSRLADQLSARNADLVVDAETAGQLLAVTPRTARRLLHILVEEGLAWPLPPNQTPQPGRPRQFYRLIAEQRRRDEQAAGPGRAVTDPVVLAFGPALVGAIATDTWPQVREAVTGLWHRAHPGQETADIGADLDDLRTQVLLARRDDDTSAEEALEGAWQLRIQQLLRADAFLAAELRRVLDEVLTPALAHAQQARIERPS